MPSFHRPVIRNDGLLATWRYPPGFFRRFRSHAPPYFCGRTLIIRGRIQSFVEGLTGVAPVTNEETRLEVERLTQALSDAEAAETAAQEAVERLRAEAVAKRMVVDRFGFDYELLVLAIKLGYKVKQMPVRWMNEEGSTVNLFGPNGYIQVFVDLFKTKWRLLTGAYHIKEHVKEKSAVVA
jgi:hypothetical protein